MNMSEVLEAVDKMPEEMLKDLIEYARLTLNLIEINRSKNTTAE
jgi:hypothetical protein